MQNVPEGRQQRLVLRPGKTMMCKPKGAVRKQHMMLVHQGMLAHLDAL